MSIAVFAAWFLVVTNLLVALFQLALALGAPMGQYAFGGRNVGKLPMLFRAISLGSFLVLLAIAGHYLSVLGVLPSLLDAHGRAYSLWALTAFYALSLIGNLASKSKAERKMFVPITAAMVLANILILVFYRLA